MGEVIPDTHDLVLPASVPPGNARLQLGLFPPFAEEGLPVADGDAAEWATLAGVEIEPQEGLPALPVERRALFGSGTWLTGLDLPVEARQGGSMPLTMGWRVRSLDLTDFLVLTWQDEAGNEAACHEVRLPASLDGVGAFHLQQALPVPAAPGRYELSVAWLDADDRPKPARCAWLAKRSADCLLGAVTVLATQEDLANYENLILLTGAEADTHSAASGGAIQVTLRWRSLRAVPEDYTLFVQAIGPDGRAHGQIDTWPLQGSFPTSQWSQGQTVTDQVSLWLEPDAPAGRYQMVVGWYLLATMQRLQIVDADGRALADAFTIAEWEYGG
ncbi:MAG: hypothetical protein GX601_02210 [Anaerolineales bacterium]|nr:hypothetical protein [Anaerolineales bacterium]